MDQLMGFGFENKHNKQSLKIYPGTLGLLNIMNQLQHFILCNMMCYHIFCCNKFVFACLIIAKSQCWLFALRTNTGQIYPYFPSNIRICPHISVFAT